MFCPAWMHDSHKFRPILGEAYRISFDKISPSESQTYFTLDLWSILVWDAVLWNFSLIGLLWLRNETNQCLARLIAVICLSLGFEDIWKLPGVLNALFICPRVKGTHSCHHGNTHIRRKLIQYLPPNDSIQYELWREQRIYLRFHCWDDSISKLHEFSSLSLHLLGNSTWWEVGTLIPCPWITAFVWTTQMPDWFDIDSEVAGHFLAGTHVCFQKPRSLVLRTNCRWGWNKLVKTYRRPHDLKMTN